MTKISFLDFPLSSIRRSIKDIDDSYRNPWDIYAELSQNAVDAIRKMQETHDEDGKIKIIINSQEKSIYFEDNGCGIAKDNLPQMLKLFSSGKDEDSRAVGEKGVGLKFVLFQSNYFEIESSDGETAGKAVIKDARGWKTLSSDVELEADFEGINPDWRGTKITLKDIEVNSDDEEQSLSLFQLSFEQLKYVLRNKTYLGSTVPIWDDDYKPIDIFIKYKDYNGVEYEDTLENEYILPIEDLLPTDMVDIDKFEEWLNESDRSDTEKIHKLQGKVLFTKGEYKHKNYRKISFWACFLPTRRDWDDLNKRLNLVPSGEEVDDSFIENNGYCLCSAGIYTATKGMPTGISITQPSTGSAGYWSNFFMLFQDDALKFDIGRKSIHSKTQKIYQKKSKEIFNKITSYVTKYTSAVPVTPSYTNSFDRDEIRDNINGLADLNSEKVSFVKNPAKQEAAVSAIFFELIGKGLIDDIIPIYLGYRNKYDLYAYYKSPQTNKKKFGFYEFKSHLRNLTKDFSEAIKVFDELDYVICWDVNDTDIQELFNFGIGCEKIENSSLHPIDCPASVTHRLVVPNCNPVYVIDLKELV